MSEGIGRNNEIEIQASMPAAPLSERPVLHEGIPLDFIYHYDLEISALDNRTKEKLVDIFNLVDGNDVFSKLKNLRKIENRLGQPSMQETRYGKTWHHLRLNQYIKNRGNHGK